MTMPNQLEITTPVGFSGKVRGTCSWIIIVLLMLIIFGGVMSMNEMHLLHLEIAELSAKLDEAYEIIMGLAGNA